MYLQVRNDAIKENSLYSGSRFLIVHPSRTAKYRLIALCLRWQNGKCWCASESASAHAKFGRFGLKNEVFACRRHRQGSLRLHMVSTIEALVLSVVQ